MTEAAQIVSWVFMPLFIPVYAIFIVMYVPSDHYFFNPNCIYYLSLEGKTALIFRFLLLGVVAPGVSFYILQRMKIISSIEMETRKERTIPIVVMFFYCLLLYSYQGYEGEMSPFLPKYIYSLPLSGMLVTFVFFFLNRWKKISIHAASAGILVGFLLAFAVQHHDYQMWIIAFGFIVSGLVMSARLFLNKHTLFEVLLGWAVGSFITFIVNILYVNQ